MPVPPYDADIVAAIRAEADRLGLPKSLLVALALLEGGLRRPFPVGDDGRAFGPYQVRVDVHGPGNWDDPREVGKLMGWRWQKAWRDLDGDTNWLVDPVGFIQRYQPRAQGSTVPSRTRSEAAIAGAMALEEMHTPVIDFPPSRWVDAAPGNYSEGRNGYAPEVVVLHRAQGTLQQTVNHFANPNNQFRTSSHYVLNHITGEIVQMVSLDNAAHTNGNAPWAAENPNLWVLQQNPGADLNDLSVTIEVTGVSGERITEVAREQLVWLIAATFDNTLLKSGATGVVVDRNHVLGHRDAQPKSRPDCPGWGEDYHMGLIQDVVQRLAVAPAPVEPDWRALLRVAAEGLEDIAQRAAVQAESLRKAAG